MPKRHFSITDGAAVALEQMQKKYPQKSYGQIVSEALINYSLMDNRDYAKTTIDEMVERGLLRLSNRIVGKLDELDEAIRFFLKTSNLTTNMVLYSILDEEIAKAKRRDPNVDGVAVVRALQKRGQGLMEKLGGKS